MRLDWNLEVSGDAGSLELRGLGGSVQAPAEDSTQAEGQAEDVSDEAPDETG